MKMNQQEASQFVLDLKFKSSIIEQTKTELNYDILCLVAEVGGHLSLLLGLCGFGILSSIINVIFSKNQIITFSRNQIIGKICFYNLGKILQITNFILMLTAFGYWSVRAVDKYNYEPLSSESAIITKINMPLEFPKITICPPEDYDGIYGFNHLHTNIGAGTWIRKHFSFFSILEEILSSYQSGSIPNIMDNFTLYEINDLVELIQISSEDQSFAVENIKSISELVYHEKFGFCHTIDIALLENSNLIDGRSVTLEILFKKPEQLPNLFVKNASITHSNPETSIFLHDSNNLPSASQHSSVIKLKFGEKFNLKTPFQHEYIILKETISMEASRKISCGVNDEDLYPKECQDFHSSRILLETYNCQIPWFFTGNHIDIKKNLAICDEKVALKAFAIRKEAKTYCSDNMPCHISFYQANAKPRIDPVSLKSGPLLQLTMKNSMDKYEAYTSYHFLNLFTEIGGIMGLFLGWSFFSILNGIVDFFMEKKSVIKINRVKIQRGLTIIFLMSFLALSWEFIEMYSIEKESLEIVTKKGYSQFPFVTICPSQQFQTAMGIKYPCIQNYTNKFFDGVKNCLSTNPDMIQSILEIDAESDSWLNLNNDGGQVAVTIGRHKSKSKIINNVVLEKVFHEEYGLCFTLDPKNWERCVSD